MHASLAHTPVRMALRPAARAPLRTTRPPPPVAELRPSLRRRAVDARTVRGRSLAIKSNGNKARPGAAGRWQSRVGGTCPRYVGEGGATVVAFVRPFAQR